MEDYPELKNNTGTPSYDEHISGLVELWASGLRLNPEDMVTLIEARPDLFTEEDYSDEGTHAA